MNTYEVIIPKLVQFSENEIYIVKAKNKQEAWLKVENGTHESYPEYEDAGDYETIDSFEPTIKKLGA